MTDFITSEGWFANFYTFRELIDKGLSAESIRYTLLSIHYRQKLNFTFERLDSAQKAINKLQELSRRLKLISDNNKEIQDFQATLHQLN